MNPNNSFLNSGSFQLYKLVVAMMFSFPTAPIMILMGGFVGSKLAFNPEFKKLLFGFTKFEVFRARD